jgi:8-hydroxy-5-deazaflavin:NADPH oxidoreductase
MKIAVIGMGNVGGTLGRRWASGGHEVVFGVRDPLSPKAVAGAGRLKLATIAEAAVGVEVIVLAVPWDAVEDALAAAGDLTGKVPLDCTNPLTSKFTGLELSHTTSGAEKVTKLAPGAKVVKIFSTTGADNMANPDYDGTPVTMLYAGDDPGAKQLAASLAKELGFDLVDVGPLQWRGCWNPWRCSGSRSRINKGSAATLPSSSSGVHRDALELLPAFIDGCLSEEGSHEHDQRRIG